MGIGRKDGHIMKIVHAAIYTLHLEEMKDFYCTYFGGRTGERYLNPKSGFVSYFVRFDSEAALELMSFTQGITAVERGEKETGYSHIAFSVGGKVKVNELTARLKADGFSVVSGPRTTGDGYYESCFLDPDGNRVEITE